MIDRKVAPISQEIVKIDISKAFSLELEGGNFCYYIDQPELKVLKFEIEFNAGSTFQKKALLANMVSTLLLEGTEKFTAFEIAEYFDSRGAFVESSCNSDTASIVLHCMERNVDELLPFISELISSATFPQKEINSYLEIHSQKFQVNQEKVSWVARNEFLGLVLGKENDYAKKITAEDFNRVEREDLLAFYEKYYRSSNFNIFLSGKVSSKVLESVKTCFSRSESVIQEANIIKSVSPSLKNQTLILKESAIQSAIRMGGVSLNRSHKDFPTLFIANTLLGGYFGSRLMTNIREDKGYTYGIGSGIIHYKDLSYFVVSTEVGSDVTKDTLAQIEIEMNRLGSELVHEEELGLVKNYILGNLLKGFDGSFSSMERFQMLNSHGLGYDYYQNIIEKVRTVTAKEIKAISKEYLSYSKMVKLIVGKF